MPCALSWYEGPHHLPIPRVGVETVEIVESLISETSHQEDSLDTLTLYLEASTLDALSTWESERNNVTQCRKQVRKTKQN